MRVARLRRQTVPLALASMALVAGSVVGGGSAATATTPTVTKTFAATGAVQTYTLPAGVCGVTVTATGGSGGASPGLGLPASGGLGATVEGHLDLPAGTTLEVLVGESGAASYSAGADFPAGDGGFGGGGGGGAGGGGGGGGASAVFDTAGPLVAAGAGGGGLSFASVANDGNVYDGGDAGVLGSDGAPGDNSAGLGGTATGDGGATLGTGNFRSILFAAGAGGGVGQGGTSSTGKNGGDGADGFGGGGGAASYPDDLHPGHDAGPGQLGLGGAGHPNLDGPSGNGADGAAGGGDGAESTLGSTVPNHVTFAGGGGGGGGPGFAGGGGAALGGGGGAGYGAGAGGLGGAGSGGSSWITPTATSVGSQLASAPGNGTVTISYDPTADACPTVLPGAGIVTAPTSGTADLAVSVSLSKPSPLPVTVNWTTRFAPGAPDGGYIGPQAPITDYVPSNGTITFAPGDTTAIVHIPVTHCSSTVGVEYVIVSFLAQTNARNGGFYGLGFGVILAAP